MNYTIIIITQLQGAVKAVFLAPRSLPMEARGGFRILGSHAGLCQTVDLGNARAHFSLALCTPTGVARVNTAPAPRLNEDPEWRRSRPPPGNRPKLQMEKSSMRTVLFHYERACSTRRFG